VASAVVARMHAEAAFRADMDAARAELLALRAAPSQAQGQACDVEAQTLQSWR
jgi:acid phosphatase (class A)